MTHFATLLDSLAEHVVALVLGAAADALADILRVAENVLPVVGFESSLVGLLLVLGRADLLRRALARARQGDRALGGFLERVGKDVTEEVERVGEEVAQLGRREEERDEFVQRLAGVAEFARRRNGGLGDLDVDVDIGVNINVGVAGSPDESAKKWQLSARVSEGRGQFRESPFRVSRATSQKTKGTYRWILSSWFFSRTRRAMAWMTRRSWTTTLRPRALSFPPPTLPLSIPPMSGCRSELERSLRTMRSSWSEVGILPAWSAPYAWARAEIDRSACSAVSPDRSGTRDRDSAIPLLCALL